MLILKLAAVTCAFYLAAAVLTEAAIMVLAHVLGGFGVHASRWGWLFFFGGVWLASFLLAYRVVVPPILAKISL